MTADPAFLLLSYNVQHKYQKDRWKERQTRVIPCAPHKGVWQGAQKQSRSRSSGRFNSLTARIHYTCTRIWKAQISCLYRWHHKGYDKAYGLHVNAVGGPGNPSPPDWSKGLKHWLSINQYDRAFLSCRRKHDN